MKLSFMLNERPVVFDVRPDEKFLEVLRREGYTGAKRGCEDNSCGACTILLEDRAVLSCSLFAGQVEGRRVTTIEGIGTVSEPHPIQTAFVEAGAVQCGYCMPGMILSTKALLGENSRPSEEDMREALDGNLCRCTGYTKIYDAVKRAAATLADNDAKRGSLDKEDT